LGEIDYVHHSSRKLLEDYMFFIYPSSFEKRIEFNSPIPKEVAQ
jgi:hypothetical protein